MLPITPLHYTRRDGGSCLAHMLRCGLTDGHAECRRKRCRVSGVRAQHGKQLSFVTQAVFDAAQQRIEGLLLELITPASQNRLCCRPTSRMPRWSGSPGRSSLTSMGSVPSWQPMATRTCRLLTSFG